MKPFVGRSRPPTTSTRPTFEPIPKAKLEIDRTRTVMTTSSASESDALMQYLLRPISTLPCFISDAQNMAEAPGFGASLLHITGRPANQLTPSADCNGIYMLGTLPCRTVRLVGLVVGVWEPDSGKKCFATRQ